MEVLVIAVFSITILFSNNGPKIKRLCTKQEKCSKIEKRRIK